MVKQSWQVATSTSLGDILAAAYAFPEEARVVDVGGGDGTLLAAILTA